MVERILSNIELGFDVVIVGAGAAGCVLAKELSSQYKVLLVDSREFPRRKACSGILVAEAIDFFGKKLDDKITVDSVKLDIEYVDLNNKTKKLTHKGFVNADRAKLDNFLFEQVKDKDNVSFLQKTKVIEFAYAEDKIHKVIVCESNGVLKPVVTKYLVGCDGALSLMIRKIFKKDIPFYVGVQELVKSNKKFDRAYFIFDNEITDFYSWIIPKGNYVEIGSLLDPYNTKEKFNSLKDKLSKTFEINGNGHIDSAIVLRPSSVKDICLGTDNILLCGEAAGLISPSSAEGISYALRSARLFAESINQKPKEALKEYTKRCKDLLDRLDSKFKKAKVLSDQNKRKNAFE